MPDGALASTDQEISIQAHLDQLEAAIGDAHGILNEIQGEGSESKAVEAPASGARSALNRCTSSVARLNGRLKEVRNAVGTL